MFTMVELCLLKRQSQGDPHIKTSGNYGKTMGRFISENVENLLVIALTSSTVEHCSFLYY